LELLEGRLADVRETAVAVALVAARAEEVLEVVAEGEGGDPDLGQEMERLEVPGHRRVALERHEEAERAVRPLLEVGAVPAEHELALGPGDLREDGRDDVVGRDLDDGTPEPAFLPAGDVALPEDLRSAALHPDEVPIQDVVDDAAAVDVDDVSHWRS